MNCRNSDGIDKTRDKSYKLTTYTQKIHAKLHEISPYFSANYKGSVLPIVLFATFRNGGLLTRYNVQTMI